MVNTKRQNITLTLAIAIAAAACLIGASNALAASGGLGSGDDEPLPGPPGKAKILKNGDALAPENAPVPVLRAIVAANSINHRPYVWGGGHASWKSRGYDCSGAVSYALGFYGAQVLSSPLPSGPLMKWGKSGRGKWITVFSNPGHVFAIIAGIRWDTSRAGATNVVPGGTGPRWAKALRSTRGYVARRPSNNDL